MCSLTKCALFPHIFSTIYFAVDLILWLCKKKDLRTIFKYNYKYNIIIGGKNLRIFQNVHPNLVSSVTHCVMTVADKCYSIGLISTDMHDQLLQRENWINIEKTRNLLSSIRTVLSTRPTALKEFVTVLSQVHYCRQVADKIQLQLQ